MPKRGWWTAPFFHVINALMEIYKAEKRGEELNIVELIKRTGMPPSTFYRSVKDALEEMGLVLFVEKENRVVPMLTERGKRFAECLDSCSEILSYLKALYEKHRQ